MDNSSYFQSLQQEIILSKKLAEKNLCKIKSNPVKSGLLVGVDTESKLVVQISWILDKTQYLKEGNQFGVVGVCPKKAPVVPSYRLFSQTYDSLSTDNFTACAKESDLSLMSIIEFHKEKPFSNKFLVRYKNRYQEKEVKNISGFGYFIDSNIDYPKIEPILLPLTGNPKEIFDFYLNLLKPSSIGLKAISIKKNRDVQVVYKNI
jgi:hypothetical protein